eukprot:TRINITY_DN4900_c0_g1_i1.p1 TRINITY_DN4900_c0_g1~~TRINITY_DN4900_c0_g1_i1.p1  ORF type:complete len:557 (+),score=210.36 TRINITY_DN4900_c0_g1_i1:54-1724(+)
MSVNIDASEITKVPVDTSKLNNKETPEQPPLHSFFTQTNSTAKRTFPLAMQSSTDSVVEIEAMPTMPQKSSPPVEEAVPKPMVVDLTNEESETTVSSSSSTASSPSPACSPSPGKRTLTTPNQPRKKAKTALTPEQKERKRKEREEKKKETEEKKRARVLEREQREKAKEEARLQKEKEREERILAKEAEAKAKAQAKEERDAERAKKKAEQDAEKERRRFEQEAKALERAQEKEKRDAEKAEKDLERQRKREEKAKAEEEKNRIKLEKQKKKEEEELKKAEELKEKELKVKAQAITSFFVLKPAVPKPVAVADPDRLFHPYVPQPNTIVAAPFTRDSSWSPEKFKETIATQVDGLSSIVEMKVSRVPLVATKERPRIPLPEGTTLTLSAVKNLLFHDNNRPGYCGSFSKKSTLVSGRRPFAQDDNLFDYDYDSDLEWVEEEPGESLSDTDGEVEDNDDDEEEGFVVPDGYLSQDEGDGSHVRGKTVKKGRDEAKMAPIIIGPIFIQNPCDDPDYARVHKFRAVVLRGGDALQMYSKKIDASEDVDMEQPTPDPIA